MNERAGMPFLFVAIVGSKAGSFGQNQFGTQLGGAVEKNKLFFSTDYQDHNLNDPTQTGQSGASVPGFNAFNPGCSQLASLATRRQFELYARFDSAQV